MRSKADETFVIVETLIRFVLNALSTVEGSRPGVCNLFHWGATFENFNNVEGQSPSNMYKIIKC